MPMTDAKFIDVDGVRTRYFEQGTGEPLVLWHGSHFGTTDACDSALDWEPNFDGLAESFRVIAVDKLGQGHTDNPKTDDDYTPGAVVEHAYGFLKAMGLKDVHVGGHSRGGYVVARLTLLHPEIVKSCIIVDSGSLSPGPSLTELVMAGRPEPYLSRESQRWVVEHYSYGTAHITDHWIDAAVEIAELPKYQESVRKMSGEGLKDTLFMRNLVLDKEECLQWMMEGRLKTPTLVVWGYNDPTAQYKRGISLFDFVANSTENAQFHVINKAGHFCYREQPEQFNRAVAGFIKGLD